MDTLAKDEITASLGTNRLLAHCRVAYILTPVHFGGAEQVSLSYLKHFHRHDTTIHPILLCRPWEQDNPFLTELRKNEIHFHTIPTRLRPKEDGTDHFRVARCARQIYRHVKSGDFHLIHTHGYFANTVGLFTAKLLGLPIVTTCHGFISNTIKYRLYNTLDVLLLRFMNRVIAVSDGLKNDLVGKGLKENNIEIVQNAVEPVEDPIWKRHQRNLVREKYGISDKEFTLGYVGRLSEEKGIRHLLLAGSSLLSRKKLIRILIVGDGPQKAELEAFVKSNEMEEKVHFAGFQQHAKELLPALDAFILPSFTEGTSMALLEAMACKLPVIATAVGGTPKVINSHQNGILIPPGSAEVIIDSVSQLMEQDHLRNELGAAALQTIKTRFCMSPWIDRIDGIYREILQHTS